MMTGIAQKFICKFANTPETNGGFPSENILKSEIS